MKTNWGTSTNDGDGAHPTIRQAHSALAPLLPSDDAPMDEPDEDSQAVVASRYQEAGATCIQAEQKLHAVEIQNLALLEKKKEVNVQLEEIKIEMENNSGALVAAQHDLDTAHQRLRALGVPLEPLPTTPKERWNS